MSDTPHDTHQEEPTFHRNPGRFNRNGQHWVYFGIATIFSVLLLLIIVNFFLTGHFNILLLCTNLVGLFATMFCHTRYFQRSGERAPWHSWKLFKTLRR